MNNTFYFQIRGKVIGDFKDKTDVSSYLWELLINKVEFQIDYIDEDEDND